MSIGLGVIKGCSAESINVRPFGGFMIRVHPIISRPMNEGLRRRTGIITICVVEIPAEGDTVGRNQSMLWPRSPLGHIWLGAIGVGLCALSP